MTQTPDPESAQAARWHRREHLAVLLSRAARGVLTPKEGPLLRAAVDTELADAEEAHRRAERAEQQAAAARAYADALCAEPHPTHDHVCPDDARSGLLAALDAAGQPDTSEETGR